MKPIVYLDMDETLLHTRGYLTRPPSQARIEEARRLKGVRLRFIQSQIKKAELWKTAYLTEFGHTLVRPGAHDFIKRLATWADVYVFSAGQLDYVTATLKATKLDEHLLGCFSVHEQHDLPNDRPWLLVDNLKPGTVGVKVKVCQVLKLDVEDPELAEQISTRYCLTVLGWTEDDQDRVLDTLDAAIRARLS
jgi:hypothetical protein